MTEQEAKRYVAAQLAYLALQHQQAVAECPNLAENTEDAIRKLRDATTALGFRDEFEVSCPLFAVRLCSQPKGGKNV